LFKTFASAKEAQILLYINLL